jgi:Kae1-associated kinase Bud32
MMKGAEAILKKMRVQGLAAVEKFRVKKSYRACELDEKIRRERTRREARLLLKAKSAGVLCPVVYEVGDFSIRMKYLEGEMLYHALQKRALRKSEIAASAKILARLHSQGIIHGDFTPANLMLVKDGMAVIDFGLGFISTDNEDRGTDIVTMRKALTTLGAKGKQDSEAFLRAYLSSGGKPAVAKMVAEIESRARYMERS